MDMNFINAIANVCDNAEDFALTVAMQQAYEELAGRSKFGRLAYEDATKHIASACQVIDTLGICSDIDAVALSTVLLICADARIEDIEDNREVAVRFAEALELYITNKAFNADVTRTSSVLIAKFSEDVKNILISMVA